MDTLNFEIGKAAALPQFGNLASELALNWPIQICASQNLHPTSWESFTLTKNQESFLDPIFKIPTNANVKMLQKIAINFAKTKMQRPFETFQKFQ